MNIPFTQAIGSPTTNPGRKPLSLIVGLLVAADLAHAQQPVAELGGWPAGAFTLLIGLWIAARCALQRNYDTSLPPCTRAGLHRIPYIKRLLWAGDTLGQSVNVLVLSSLEAPKWNLLPQFTTDDEHRSGVWEWDILTIYKAGGCPTPCFALASNDPNENATYEMKISAPARCGMEVVIKFTANPSVKIGEITDILFTTLFAEKYGSRPCADLFLLLWRGLQNYQSTWELRHGGETSSTGEPYSCTEIVEAVREYKSKPKEVVDWLYAEEKLRLYIENPTDTSDEAAPGSTIRDDVFHAGQLVAMLIFTENFPGATGVNPLIPLIYQWSKGKLEPTDNFQFTLRQFKKLGAPPSAPGLNAQLDGDGTGNDQTPPLTTRFQRASTARASRAPTVPVSRKRTTPLARTGTGLSRVLTHVMGPKGATSTVTSEEVKLLAHYEINLSEGDVQIDGGGHMGSQRYAWIWSTVVGAIIAFFISLGGTANPSFATALGLSLLRPYSNDDNYTDAGSPLSWNGRRRIRWDEDKACGIFSGQTKLRLGKTGNSITRGCILFVFSWLTWIWRDEVREVLSFEKPVNAATWVKWTAVFLEAHAGLWMFLGSYFYYQRRIFSVVVINLVAGVHVVVVVVLMVNNLKTGQGRELLFYTSEAFTLTGCFVTGQTFVGSGSEHAYVHHAVTLYWSHIVAASCFSYIN